MPALHAFLNHSMWSRVLVGAALAAALALVITATPAQAQWPTSCVELNDIVEAHLGNQHNVGIYQRVFGEQAEAHCQLDHRADVQDVFAWAIGGSGGAYGSESLAWPTSCVELNDIVEAHLGNQHNVGIYQSWSSTSKRKPTASLTTAPTSRRSSPGPSPLRRLRRHRPPPPPPPPTSAPIGEASVLAASPLVFQDQTLWLGTTTGGILRSTNGGRSWAQAISGLPNVTINDIAASTDGAVVAATNVGIGYSSDRGATWVAAAGAPSSRISGVAASPRFSVDRSFYAIAESGTVLRSSDAGANWSTASVPQINGLPIGGYLGLLTAQGRGERIHIFTWTSSAFFVSDDLGNSFKSLIGKNALPGKFQITVAAVHPEWHYDRAIWLGSHEHGIYRSEDGGQTFHSVLRNDDNALGRVNVIALSPNATRDGTIVAGTAKRGFFLSKRGQRIGTVDNIGAPNSWNHQSVNLNFPDVRGLAFSNGYSGDRTIYAAGAVRFAVTGTGAIDWFTYPAQLGQ